MESLGLRSSISHFATPEERASDTATMEVNASIASSRKNLTLEERAPAIKPGDTRSCELCDKPIPKDRLEVLPHTTTCVSCQRAFEKGEFTN